MNSLSPLYKLFRGKEKAAICAMAFMWIGSLSYVWHYSHHWEIPATLTLGSLACVFIWHCTLQNDKALLTQLVLAHKDWCDGNVSTRIVEIGGEKSQLQQLAWGLNDLMDQVEASLVDTHYSMLFVTQGDFSRRSYPDGLRGSFAHALHRLNELTQILSNTTQGINALMEALSCGNFKKTINLNVEGEYAKAIANATKAMDMMRTMLDNIGEVMEHVAQGDVSHRVHAQGQGDFAVLKNNINISLDSLEGSLNDIERLSHSLSKGDLTQSIEKLYPGTFGVVLCGMNSTVQNLKQMVGEIKSSSTIIANAAQEIAAGNHDLAYRTEDQAKNLEKTARNIADFTHVVQKNNESANHANSLAHASSNITRTGSEAVKQVVFTMDGINDSSSKIVDIISVIDGIAFQTNILALNAAVEAARAGEQGRGFAVVATEVRSLAQRASSAAGEIKNLIRDSVDKAQDGTRFVTKAGENMQEILNSIENVTDTIKQISIASREQTTGINEINQALNNMEHVTQQNAALVEEAAAAAKSLEEQTKHLAQTIGRFKTDD